MAVGREGGEGWGELANIKINVSVVYVGRLASGQTTFARS